MKIAFVIFLSLAQGQWLNRTDANFWNEFKLDSLATDLDPSFTLNFTDTAYAGHDAHQILAPAGSAVAFAVLIYDTVVSGDTAVVTGWSSGQFDSAKFLMDNSMPLDSAPTALGGNFIGVWDSIYSLHVIHHGGATTQQVLLQNFGPNAYGNMAIHAWPRNFSPLGYVLLQGGTTAHHASLVYGKYNPYLTFDINATQKYCWVTVPLGTAGFNLPIDMLYVNLP